MLIVNQRQSNHIILIFADKADNRNVIQQINILKKDPSGVKNRSIIFKVIPYSAINMQHYKKWHVQNMPFTVLLIGRDDGEKLRSHEPVTLVKLFDLIDNMSARQMEIRYRQ